MLTTPLRTTRIVAFATCLMVTAYAGADVFTKNQLLRLYASPPTIAVTDDSGSSRASAVPVGTPVHIVYGIQVTSANTSPSAVSVTTTLPPGFAATAVKCARFPGGAATGTSFTSGCTLASLPTFSIGALSTANDKVIIIIDGYFTQAGNFTTFFDAKRDATTERTSLNMLAQITALPVDLSVTKEVVPKGGSPFASSTSVATGGTVTFRIVVKNESAPAANHSTDVALGTRFKLQDVFSTPNANDVTLVATSKSATCTASGGAECPQLFTGTLSNYVLANSSSQLTTFTYPSTLGLLPAGGSFEILFDASIATSPALACSKGQNNSLKNSTFFTYSDGSTSVGDANSSNNTAEATVAVTGIPASGCLPPPTATITKKLLSTPAWGVPLRYLVTITNTSSQTLTGIGLYDYVYASGTPPITATFDGTSVQCTPACSVTIPTTSDLVVPGASSPYMFTQSALFAPLAAGATQTIEYTIKYEAGCAMKSGRGTITNVVSLFGPVSGSASAAATMPELDLCSISATKQRTGGPTEFSLYPQTLKYHVDFRNTSSTGSVTVRTMIDAIAMKSAGYGDVPMSYTYSCTASGVTFPTGTVLSGSGAGSITYNNPVRAGVKLIDFESKAGAVFAPGGVVGCDIEIKVQQPSANDAFCRGDDTTDLLNLAFMDLGYPFNTNYATPAKESDPVVVKLPKCVAISVGKTIAPNVVAGGAATFTLTVTNAAKSGTIGPITMHDDVPTDFTNVTWTCASGCAAGSGFGSHISVPLQPIAAGATTSIVVHANAPTILGTYCNATNATFDPFPTLSYFEGDQAALTKASACAQVETPPGLIIHKEVPGAPSGFTGQFPFTVQCTTQNGPYTKSVTVGWPSPGFVAVNDIPPNSNCTVTEGTVPAAPQGYSWSGSPVYTPTGGKITIGDTGGVVNVVNKLTPESCLRIVLSSVTCELDKNGKPTGKYIWQFRFRNLTGVPASHLFISGLPFPVTVNDNHLEFIPAVTNVSPLNTFVFSGASPGALSFNLSLHCGGLDECCSTRVTIDLPACDCAQVIGDGAPSCSFPNPSPLSYTIRLQNLSANIVQNLLIVPVSPFDHTTAIPPAALSVTNEINPVAAAGQGGTIGPVTVKLSGTQAVPGAQVCLSIGLEEKDFNHCCSIVRCFRLPKCSPDWPYGTPIGSATVAQLDDGFRIDHIGATGADGVSIPLDGARRAGLAWQPLDSSGPLPNGAFIELRAAGLSGQQQGSMRVTQTALDRFEVTSSIDDARTYRIEAFDGTESTGAAVSQLGINVIVIWPVAAGVELQPASRSGDPDTLAFTLQADSPAPWMLSDGTILIGDRIRITPEQSSGRTASLQTLELRAAKIPSIVVTGVSIDRDCNGNGVSDAEEIASGAAADDNDNGIPDECESAAGVTISFNSGYNQTSGSLLPLGGHDDDWTIVAPGPERAADVVANPHPNWGAPLPLTRWLSTDTDRGVSTSATLISYERCFCLAEGTHDIGLNLQVRADNVATVLLNGRTVGGPGGEFNRSPLTIRQTGSTGDGLFIAGRNCLRINVSDFGSFTGLDVTGMLSAIGRTCSSP